MLAPVQKNKTLSLPQHCTCERAFARSSFAKQQHEKHRTLLVPPHSEHVSRMEAESREIQLDCSSDTTNILHRHLLPWTAKPKTPHRYFTQNRLKTERLCVWFACLKTCSSLFIPNKLQQTATILQSKMWHGSWQGFPQKNSDILEFVHIIFIWDIQNNHFFGWPREVKLIELWKRLSMNSQAGR